jgi:AbrB family looped-hinge helix DNA binding protein
LPNERKKEFAFTVYLRKEGRVTIPKEVRDALGIEEGALVECRVSKVE